MIRVPYISKWLIQGGCNAGRGKSHFVNHRYSDLQSIVSRKSVLTRSVELQQIRSYNASTRRCSNTIPSWATFDPNLLGTTEKPYAVQNIVNGVWQSPPRTSVSNTNMDDIIPIPHPYNTDVPYPIFTVPNTTNIQPFVDSLRQCPKTGLHNPLKNVERYTQYGDISRKVNDCLAIF